VRIGQGFDAHALAAGYPLTLGGVAIPSEVGLAGHSDADVLLHAVCDGLLGACGAGDIGSHFPDSDPANAGRSSREFVRAAAAEVSRRGWAVANLDCTVVAQRPKLAPYIDPMRANIAADLGLQDSAVNVKATTTEYLGWTGRGEGMAALAVALLLPA
jgi:2-C-methyl-D-erythritol 2,4-cyclodiphosphate synthase